jgi:hypothetical protein
MIEEYIWRSEQVTAEDNPMSTLIVSFYENKQEAEYLQGFSYGQERLEIGNQRA